MSDPSSPNLEPPKPASLLLTKERIGSRTNVLTKRQTFRFTLLLGIVAGLVFSLALWGYEAILLIQSHVAYPWMPCVVGTILVVCITTLAALLTWLVNRALVGAIFWVLAAWSIAELAITLPLKITPALMMFLGTRITLQPASLPDEWHLPDLAGFGTVWLGIFLLILGLLQLTLVESSVPATTAAGRLAAFFIFVPVMILASVLSSNMINQQMRAPLLNTDNVIQFAINHQNGTSSGHRARDAHGHR